MELSVSTLILVTTLTSGFQVSNVSAKNDSDASVLNNTAAIVFIAPENDNSKATTTTTTSTTSTTTLSPQPEKRITKRKVKAKYEVTTRYDDKPSTISFTPKIKDLENQPSLYREPARSPPLPVLSSTEDFTLNSPEVDDKSAPVAYETIVYDPDTRDATAAFSRSQIWDTPELVIKDTVRREEGKNSLQESASHLEYTPHRSSVQTPLNQIRHGRQQQHTSRYAGTTLQPLRKPTAPIPTSTPTRPVYENNRVDGNEDAEEESSQRHSNEKGEREELNDDEGESEESSERKYPVRLQEESFSPFAAVGEPEDIYSDVLSNIGSVFSDDEIPVNEEVSFRNEGRDEKPNGYRELLPQFERHSYENLQHEDDRVDDDDGDGNEELEDGSNEELNELEDEDAGLETKQVQKSKPTPNPPPPPPPPPQRPYQQRRPDGESQFGQSPFPNVKIVRHGQSPPKNPEGPSTPLPFSPWLPVQGPSNPAPTHSWQRQQGTWHRPNPASSNLYPQHSQQKAWVQQKQNKPVSDVKQQKKLSWPHHKNHRNEERPEPSNQHKSSTLKKNAYPKQPSWQKSSSAPTQANKQLWQHSNEKSEHTKSEPDENDPSKPYHEAYSKSYQNSWQSDSPKKKEQNSYSQTWEENQPVVKYQSNQGKLESEASEKKEVAASRPKIQPLPKLKTSKKVTREIPVEELAGDGTTEGTASSKSSAIFVTPVPEDSIDSMASPSKELVNPLAAHDIDDLYAKQSDNVGAKIQ